MKPYPDLKDVRFEWFGEIPSHWEIIPIKLLEGNSANVVQTGPFGAQLHASDYLDDGVPLILIKHVNNLKIANDDLPKISLEKAEQLSMYRLEKGDIVFSRVGSIGRIALVDEQQVGWLISGQMLRMRIRNPKVHHPFAIYAITAYSSQSYFDLTSVGSTRDSINTDILRNFPIPIPPLSEQQAIAHFLDCKTAQIDRLIEKKHRQIDLLQEQRTALINHVVTKGLNPNVPMKDSGVEWLGEIPSRWGVARLSYLTERIGDGLHGTPEYVDASDYHFINGNNLVRGEIQFFESTKCVSEDEFKKHDVGLNDKTILLSINGTIGNIAFYQGEKVMLGKSAAYIVFQDDLLKNYFFYYLQSTSIQNYFGLESTGTTIYNLSLKSIRSTPLPLPPDNEKKAIADYLDKQQLEFDKATDIIIRQIDTLKEYRTALISEAVTGKIDVRKES